MSTDILDIIKDRLGGNAGVARALKEAGHGGCTPQAVSQWKQVPMARVLAIESLTGISRHEQRPDMFGPAPSASKPSVAA